MSSSRKLSIIAVAVVVVACSHAATSPPSGERFVKLFPVDAAHGALLKLNSPDALKAPPQSGPSEADVFAECTDDGLQPPAAPIVMAIFAPLVSAGVGLALDSLDDQIKAEIAKYSAEYEASAWRSVGVLQRVDCLRFVRGVTTKGTDEIEMDLVVKLERVTVLDTATANAVPSHAVFAKPLRLFMSETAAANASTNGKYGLATSLSVTTIDDGGRREMSNVSLLKEDLALVDGNGTPKPYIKYYFDPSQKICQDGDGTADNLRCLEIPTGEYVHIPLAASDPKTIVGLKVSAAEVGTPKKYLVTIQKLLEAAKGDIGEGLADIANEKLGLKDSD